MPGSEEDEFKGLKFLDFLLGVTCRSADIHLIRVHLQFSGECRSRKLLFGQQRHVLRYGDQRLFGANYSKNVSL